MTSSRFGARSTCDDVVTGLDLRGRAMLVTGANSGIGLETARCLAAAGARVLLGCRKPENGEASAARIRAQHPGAEVTPVELDLASFRSVRRAAAGLPADGLDALICNAGLYANRYETTEDGIESTVGVCHFGHFLLTKLLLDRLAVRAGRLVMVSSESHRHPATLSFERFPLSEAKYKPLVSYGQAKLCNVLFANEFTRRYQERGLYANSLHPGSFIGTSIFRTSLAAKAIALIASPFTKTIPQGAATTVYCAVAPELAKVGGRYFRDCAEVPMSRGAEDTAAAGTLWDLSERRVTVA